MTEILYYECDVCCCRVEYSEIIGIERQLGEAIDWSEDGPAKHLCIACFDSLREHIKVWVKEKNE